MQSDAELMDRLKKREPDALGAVYDRYGRVVYALLFRITRDASVAEDLVQELFLRVWNRARNFDPEKGGLGPWIVSIARNLGIDHIRSATAKFKRLQQPLDHLKPVDISYRSSERSSFSDELRSVQEAFSKLSPNEKRVMELAYFEGYTQTEIADKLQEPLGTVKTWMRSATNRLRTAVKRGAVL
jgi:RNA polymerase sigma-70 factor, ECF subfamily